MGVDERKAGSTAGRRKRQTMNGKMSQKGIGQGRCLPISATDVGTMEMAVSFLALSGFAFYGFASTGQLNAMLAVMLACFALVPCVFLAPVVKRMSEYRRLSKNGEEFEAKVVDHKCVPGLTVGDKAVWNLKVAYLDSHGEVDRVVLELGDVDARTNYPIGSTVKMLTDGRRFVLASRAYSKRLPDEDKLIAPMHSRFGGPCQYDQRHYGIGDDALCAR